MRPARTFVCTEPNCTYTAKHKHLLVDHQRSKHSDEPPVPCSVCGRLYKSALALAEHERRHRAAGRPPLMCDGPGCDYSTQYAYLLKSHKESHSGSRSFVCDVEGCGAAFFNSGTLYTHKRRHAAEGPAAASAPRLHCSEEGCTFNTTTRTALERHARAANHGKAHLCPEPLCGEGFASAPALAAHARAHAAQTRRFPCATCDFSANNRDELVRHAEAQQHSFLKCPFPECGMTFRYSSSLAMHKKRHGGVAAITCNCCQATFLKGGEYKTHVWACRNKHRAGVARRGAGGPAEGGGEAEA